MGHIVASYGPQVNVDDPIDLGAMLGATGETSHQTLTVFVPDRDRDGVEIGTQRRFVLEAANLLAEIGGGVTIDPPVEGGWYDPQAQQLVWERPVILYTYVRPEPFRNALPRLRLFLHRMGRETRQGEVAFVFGDELYRIKDFET